VRVSHVYRINSCGSNTRTESGWSVEPRKPSRCSTVVGHSCSQCSRVCGTTPTFSTDWVHQRVDDVVVCGEAVAVSATKLVSKTWLLLLLILLFSTTLVRASLTTHHHYHYHFYLLKLCQYTGDSTMIQSVSLLELPPL